MTDLDRIVKTFQSVSLECRIGDAANWKSYDVPSTALTVVSVKDLWEAFVFDVLGQLIGFVHLDHGYYPANRQHTAHNSCVLLSSRK